MAANSPLMDFFLKVSEDEDLFRRYKDDPEATMKQAGLTPEAVRAVVDGDLKTIRRLIGAKMHPGIVLVVIIKR
jgi:hypothetical protein